MVKSSTVMQWLGVLYSVKSGLEIHDLVFFYKDVMPEVIPLIGTRSDPQALL